MPASAPRPLKIAITTDIPLRNPEKLCPGGILRWGSCEFVYNPPDLTPCDFWIVYAGCPASTRMRCAPENTLFISGEPPAKKIYPRAFYAQFHHVVSANADDPHPRVIQNALSINWQVGFDAGSGSFRYGYDELTAQTMPRKELKISVVCSSLRTTEGQRLRLDFLDRLKARLGDRIVHFGRGFTPIADKMDAIAPYHYHLVLENSTHDDYWTEKLADAYLGWAFPLYLGCPNLKDYFPEAGFMHINPKTYDHTAAQIEAIVSEPPDSSQVNALKTCRDLILNTYNPFARFSHWAEKFHQSRTPARPLVIRSHKAFRPFPQGLIYSWRQR